MRAAGELAERTVLGAGAEGAGGGAEEELVLAGDAAKRCPMGEQKRNMRKRRKR